MATLEMILKIDELIEKISKYGFTSRRYHCNWYTVGVGAGFTTTTILQPGDEVKVTIDNIGTLTTYISKN